MKNKRGCAVRLAAMVAVSLMVGLPAGASVHTWSGGTGSMNLAGNWASGGVPPVAPGAGSNVTLIFPGSSTSNAVNDVANPLIVQALQLDAYYSFSITGSPIQMTNLGAAPTITGTGQSQTIAADLSLAATTSVAMTGSGWARFAGALSGPGTLAIGSGFTVYFDNATTSNSADVSVGSGSILYLNKGNNVNSVGGNLAVNGGQVQDFYANGLQATTNLSISAGGSFSNSNNEQCNNITMNTGSIVPFGGTFTIGGTITSTGAALFGGGTISFGGTQHTIDVVTAGFPNALSINTTFANGSFNKIGAGVLSLGAFANTFTGQNVVTAGVVRADAANLGNNVLNNAVVELYNGNYSGVISGTGQVNISGQVAYLAGQTYTGGTFVESFGMLDGTTSTLSGTITGIASGAQVIVNQNTNGTLTPLLTGPLTFIKYGTGVITINSANTHTDYTAIENGGVSLGASNALGTGLLQFSNGISLVTLESTTSVSLPNSLQFSGPVQVQGAGNINVTSTTNKTDNYALTHTSTGNTTIDGKFNLGVSGSITVNAGNLTLGNPAAVGGFTAQGPVTVNSGTLTLRSLNFVTLPDVTLNGGTLAAPNGYAIPLGAALQGNGAVAGRVASANGSTILANGNLVVGDGSHPAGVNLDGELYTDKFTVTLNDSNQAVLGSLTKIGAGPTIPGAIQTPNGAVLNFGRNLIGNGSIVSTNALAQAVIINGDVNGDTFTDLIDFTGYVKGVGTFNNVSFSGTFSPGLSPALLTIGNVTFGAASIFDVEVGGLNRGGQYDALNTTAMLTLNGQLKVTLINAWNPALGDVYDLINGSQTGTFSSFNFPALSPGLGWDTSQLYTQGQLQIVAVPEPATLAGLGGLSMLTLLRRRPNRTRSQNLSA